MDLSSIKDLFFFVGSTLGILSFMISVLDPVLDDNRDRWKRLAETISEENLISITHDVYQARFIPLDRLNRLDQLAYDIEAGAEYLRFGPLFAKRFESRLNRIRQLNERFRGYVQVPFWDLEERANRVGWKFDKEYFEKKSADEEEFNERYVAHLSEAHDLVWEIRREYRALSILANLQMVEVPFAKRLVAKRSPIPGDTLGPLKEP